MRRQLDTELERPVPAAKGEGFALAASGEGGPYKPMAKAERAGRESEGFTVPKRRPSFPGKRSLLAKPVKAGGGKGPCFGDGRVWR